MRNLTPKIQKAWANAMYKQCTTTTADWPMHESYWTVMTHGKGHVDLNIRDDEDGLHLIVYQASDDGSETNCCDDRTWRVFNLVEREPR